MHKLNDVIELWHRFVAWYQAGGDGPQLLWWSSGFFFFAALALIYHWLLRKILRHRKFRGTWYSERQFEVLLLQIREDQEKGNRVMRADEIQLLREFELGTRRGYISRDFGSGI